MGFVQNEKIIVGVDHKLTNGHTICRKGDLGIFGPFFLESDIVANFLPNADLHLKGHSLSQSYSADPPRLRHDDILEVRVQILRHLGCLAAARLSTDQSDGVLLDSLDDMLFVLQYW